ncbi:MAG TPA: chorismate synthase, partial [Sedimentisphaerales bacterium]|nr:chorismate synthase [Sedimentisphaerales bacterium]
MKIVLAGPKGAGKSSVAAKLAERTGLQAIETDRLIEECFERDTGEKHTCREIFIEHGEQVFRDIERKVAVQLAEADWKLIVCGGSSLLDPASRRALRKNAILIYLTANSETLWNRIAQGGLPPWLRGPDARTQLDKNVAYREELLGPYADAVIDTSDKTPEQIAEIAVQHIVEELTIRSRAANTYGDIIRITTFGESHGPAIGAVLDEVRPGIDFSPQEIQAQLNR